MKLFSKSYECICITWHKSNSWRGCMALGVQEHREPRGQRDNYTCFTPQRADADASNMLKKTPPEQSILSFWDKDPSEAHGVELYLSICFCERSSKQSSSWWCKAISFILSSGRGLLSLILLGVKSNAAFLSAQAVRTGSWTTAQQPWSTRPPPSAWIFFNFLHSFSDNHSFILYCMLSIFCIKGVKELDPASSYLRLNRLNCHGYLSCAARPWNTSLFHFSFPSSKLSSRQI